MSLKVHTLSIRYILTFSLLVILPVFVFSFLINISYGRYQRDLSKIQMQETVNQMAENLNNEIASVSILSSALIHNDSFREVCDRYDEARSPGDLYLQSEAMDLELSNLFLYTNKVGILYVYTRNKPVFLFRNFPMIKDLPEDPVPDESLENAIKSDPGSIQISDDFFSLYPVDAGISETREPMLTLAIRPKDLRTGTSIDKIMFAYKIKIFDQIYNNSSVKQFSYISDSKGHILLKSHWHTQSEDFLHSESSGLGKEKRWLVLTSGINNTGWILHPCH